MTSTTTNVNTTTTTTRTAATRTRTLTRTAYSLLGTRTRTATVLDTAMQRRWSRCFRAQVRSLCPRHVGLLVRFTRARRQRKPNNTHRPRLERGLDDIEGRGGMVYELGVAASGCRTYSGRCAIARLPHAACADQQLCKQDLIGDIITLACWKLSRKPPSETYPRGYAKFEVLGTAAVSLLLTGGALGLGLHSFSMLMESLAQSAAAMPAGPLQDALVNVTHIAHAVPHIASDHSHAHALDPNAAWFAAIGVVWKEWLFRATKKVAEQESSPVLFANALHHRSDMYGSLVALVAILGTWYWPSLPLDQIGGEWY